MFGIRAGTGTAKFPRKPEQTDRMTDSSSNRFYTLLNLFTGIVTVAVQFVTSFFLSPFIVRTLGTEANGYTQLAANFVMYASLITTAFNSMASRFVSVAYHRGETEKARRYWSSVYVTNMVLIAILLPLAALVTVKLDRIIVISNVAIPDVKTLFACVFANFFIGLVSTLYSISMYVKNAVFYSNLLNCVKTICNAVLLLVVFSCLPARLFYVSSTAAVLSLAMLPVYAHFQKRLLPEITFSRRNFSLKAVKEMCLSGIWNSINQCGHLFLTGLDLLLSNWFISPVAMGMIAVSKTIPSAIIQLGTTVNSNFSPSITGIWATGDRERLLSELRNSIKISTLLLSIPIITFCCLGRPFYALWQPTLEAGTLTVLSFLGCMAFIPLAGTQVLFNVFTAANKLKVNSLSFLATGIINVIIVYFGLKMFPQYGMYIITGTSSLLSIIRSLVIILPYIAGILGLKWHAFYRDIALTMLCGAVNFAIAEAIAHLIPATSWVGIVADGGLIAVLSFFVEGYILLTRSQMRSMITLLKNKF